MENRDVLPIFLQNFCPASRFFIQLHVYMAQRLPKLSLLSSLGMAWPMACVRYALRVKRFWALDDGKKLQKAAKSACSALICACLSSSSSMDAWMSQTEAAEPRLYWPKAHLPCALVPFKSSFSSKMEPKQAKSSIVASKQGLSTHLFGPPCRSHSSAPLSSPGSHMATTHSALLRGIVLDPSSLFIYPHSISLILSHLLSSL